jgi:hypothetical protein
MGHPRIHDGPNAHEAGLDGNHENGVRHPVVAAEPGTLPEGEDFGVCRGIIEPDGLVESPRHNPAIRSGKNSTHRHFTALETLGGLLQGILHQLVKVRLHGVYNYCMVKADSSTGYFPGSMMPARLCGVSVIVRKRQRECHLSGKILTGLNGSEKDKGALKGQAGIFFLEFSRKQK